MLNFLLGLWPQLLGIGAACVALLGLFLGIRKGGADAQKVEDQNEQLKQAEEVGGRVTDAQDAGNRTDSDIKRNPDRLREDDGHRRD